MRKQPGGKLAAERETGPSLGLDKSSGALGVAGEQMREALGKGVAVVGRVAAVEAPDRIATDRQVGKPLIVAAMDRRAEGPTSRAVVIIVPSSGADGEGTEVVPCDTNEATAGKWQSKVMP